MRAWSRSATSHEDATCQILRTWLFVYGFPHRSTPQSLAQLGATEEHRHTSSCHSLWRRGFDSHSWHHVCLNGFPHRNTPQSLAQLGATEEHRHTSSCHSLWRRGFESHSWHHVCLWVSTQIHTTILINLNSKPQKNTRTQVAAILRVTVFSNCRSLHLLLYNQR